MFVMIPSWIVSLIVLFLIIPMIGIAFYVWLCAIMSKRDIPEPPYLIYFVLFAHGGVWLLLLLTSWLNGWSGMSSLGAFYLMFISPLVAGACVFALWDMRRDSPFHKWAFRFSAAYVLGIVALFATWITYCNVERC